MYKIAREDFEDELSRIIFDLRKQYYEEKNGDALVKLVCRVHDSFIEKLSRLNEAFLDTIQRTDKTLVIFGTGLVGNRTMQALQLNGLSHRIVAFLDNNKEKWNTFLYEKPIQPVEAVIGHEKEYLVLVPFGFYTSQMKTQLLELNFPERQILITGLVPFEADSERTGKDYEAILFDKKNCFCLCGKGDLEERTFLDMINQSSISLASKEKSNYYITLEEEQKNALLEMGINRKNILSFASNIDWCQYFDPEIVPVHITGKQEVFVDGGSFNLQTSQLFLKWCGGECERIYAFECSVQGVEFCKKTLHQDKELDKITTLIPKGLWSQDTTLCFAEDDVCGTSSKVVQEESVSKIETTSIDKVLNGGKVTFIKMDIEGSELEALKGAKESISKWHPTLAISIYHKPEDIMTLPSIVKEIEPGYKLYLRCYYENHTEVVLYAIWDKDK